jgi:Ca-activated chloride channel family protein
MRLGNPAKALHLIVLLSAFAASQSTAPSQNTAPSGNQSIQPASPASIEPVPQAQQSGAQAQGAAEPSPDQEGAFVFKKQVNEVVLHATVVDEHGALVSYLDRSAFSVFEDGLPQTITSFRRQDVPVAIGVVVDNSGSMRDKRAQVNRAVLNLIQASNPQDEVFVVNFNKNPYLDQDFTSDVNLLERALHQVSMEGSTALYDAIVASAKHLENNPHLQKKVLLVITDGQDNMSRETFQEVKQNLQQKDAPTLYAIGLLSDEMQYSGRDALQKLADATGGAAFFPDSLDQVSEITRSLARAIRNQYIIAYTPHVQNVNANYHPIRVDARAPGYGQLTVRTRSGIYTGESVR